VAEEAFRQAGVRLLTLSDYEHVVEKAVKIGYISSEDQPVLAEWRKDPAAWKKD